MRCITVCAACLWFSGGALAQTYSIEPGLWEVSGAGYLAGVEMPVNETECITPEEANIDVAELLQVTENTTCSFDHANSRDFSLECQGEATFSASGVLSVDRRRIVVDATGTVSLDGTTALPASIRSTARHIGACPAP